MSLPEVPYVCQWATPELAANLIAGRATLADDANWVQSGAASPAEYVEWANHVCGMACLKMVLTHRDGTAPPLLELARRSLPYGAYVRDGERIKGLIYAPFVKFVREQFALTAEVRVNLDEHQLPPLLEQHRYFIASVHPSIRNQRYSRQRGVGIWCWCSLRIGIVSPFIILPVIASPAVRR